MKNEKTMKTTHKQNSAQGQPVHQVPLPRTASEVPGPATGTTMAREYVQMVGRMAYVWGWTLVNSHNRRIADYKLRRVL